MEARPCAVTLSGFRSHKMMVSSGTDTCGQKMKAIFVVFCWSFNCFFAAHKKMDKNSCYFAGDTIPIEYDFVDM